MNLFRHFRPTSSIPLDTRIVDKDLLRQVEETDLSLVKKHTTVTVKRLAAMDFKSLPATAKVADFIGGLRSDYQQLVDYTNSKINGISQRVKGQSHISESSELEETVESQLEAKEQELKYANATLNESAKASVPAVLRWLWIMIPMLVLITGAEIFVSVEVFSVIGGNFFTNVSLACLTGICTYWYAHFAPDKVRIWGKNKLKRQLIAFLLLLIPIATLYVVLAGVRLHYMEAMLDDELKEVFALSPYFFVIINLFAYLIAFWIVWSYKPTSAVILGYKKYKRDLKAIRKISKEKKVLEAQKMAIPVDLREKLLDRLGIIQLRSTTEDQIVSHYEACYEAFKMELYLRTNGACAKLFTGDIKQDLPPLKMLNYQNVEEDHEAFKDTLISKTLKTLTIVAIFCLTTACHAQPRVIDISILADRTNPSIKAPNGEEVRSVMATINSNSKHEQGISGNYIQSKDCKLNSV